MNVWERLGIAPTQDLRAIKRAYAIQLKTTRPDDDAQAYQALREAYDAAQHYAKYYVAYSEDEAEESAEAEVVVAANAAVETPAGAPEAVAPAPAAEPATDLAQEAIAEPIPEPVAVQTSPPPVEPSYPSAEAPDPLPPTLTVEGLVADCASVWAHHGSMGLAQAWPRFQAALDDMPITLHNQASRAFAQFVAQESDLPVDVLVALTRHFQWGLDFRVDQLLGLHLSQTLQQRLHVAEVYAAFRPDRFTHHAWALGLTRLWDNQRKFMARMLALCLDCHTRHRVLQAKTTTLHALGASRASVPAVQDWVARGGNLQGVLFVLLVGGVLAGWHQPDMLGRSVADVILLGVLAFALFFPLREFPAYEKLMRNLRGDLSLDWIAWVPVAIAVLAFVDQHFGWLGGLGGSPQFMASMVTLYGGIWLLMPTREHPWHTLVLPTFVLLLFGVQGVLPAGQLPLAISIALGWTLGAHVVLRRYPHHFEGWYAALIKLGLVRVNPLYLLGIKFIAIAWAVMAVAIIPVLLFRMAVLYRVLFAGVSMFAGALLGHAHSADWSNGGMLLWVLAAVFCIQILQTSAQKLADYGLKKLSPKP